jgi:hypothetical protein
VFASHFVAVSSCSSTVAGDVRHVSSIRDSAMRRASGTPSGDPGPLSILGERDRAAAPSAPSCVAVRGRCAARSGTSRPAVR